ncbi:MAG: hypothetical protein RLZZ76_497 [Candidatus Parcubacteria bacterium]
MNAFVFLIRRVKLRQLLLTHEVCLTDEDQPPRILGGSFFKFHFYIKTLSVNRKGFVVFVISFE